MEMGFYFCLRFRCQFFRHTKFDDWWIFKNVLFLILGLNGVMEKCVGCFLVYIFGEFFD